MACDTSRTKRGKRIDPASVRKHGGAALGRETERRLRAFFFPEKIPTTKRKGM